MSKNVNMIDIESIFKEREPRPVGRYKYFSVMLPLVEKDGKLHVLYEVRASKMKTRPGEVCFPGGGIEKGETKEQCAVRETCEELGVPANAITIINEIDMLHVYSNYTMYCYLGKLDYEELLKATPSEHEVEEYFLVPLEEMLETEPFVYPVDIKPMIGDDFPYHMVGPENTYNWSHGQYEIPIYRFGERVVWGLTARLTKSFLEVVKEQANK